MATNSSFDAHTGATTVAGAFASQIRDKTILIVGVSPNSLGAAMAGALASQFPAFMVLASRTLYNLHAVADTLPCPTSCVQVDLSDYNSVREAASTIATLAPRIDIMINNAAVVHPKHVLTPAAGHELQLATTFLGPFLLTNLLLPQLLASASSSSSSSLLSSSSSSQDCYSAPTASTRIINITSAGHRLCPIRFSDPHFRQSLSSLPISEHPPANVPSTFLPTSPSDTYAPFLAYGQAKTANILFSIALNARLLDHNGIASFACHPGSIWTELSRNLDDKMQALIKTTGGYWKTLGEGGATGLVAALDPGLVGEVVENGKNKLRVKGVYLNDCQLEGDLAAHAADGNLANKLWELAEREVGQKFQVDAAVKGIENAHHPGEETIGVRPNESHRWTLDETAMDTEYITA